MILNEHQKDSLTELINIAFGRTAASLSQLTGNRVLLEVPEVAVHPISELAEALFSRIQRDVATVHQIFSGSVAGDALLVLDYDGAMRLVNLLIDSAVPVNRMDASEREVLMEVGNILLNACLGTFGNLLQVHLSFAVPRLHLESLSAFLDSLQIGEDELRYALVVLTTFRLQGSAVEGYLVVVLGVSSLDQLLQAVETWELRQAGTV